MATSVNLPTSATTSAEDPYLTLTWVSTAQIYTDDGAGACITAATNDTSVYSYVLKPQKFGFAVPAGATIDGITLHMEAWNATANYVFNLCQLLDTGGNKVGTNHWAGASAKTTSTVTAIFSAGGAADTWGNALTVDWVNHALFGVALGGYAAGNNSDVWVDYVTLTVSFTEAGGTTNLTNVKFVEC